MLTSSITIKPNNHRVYQCPNDKKIELLNDLIQKNSKLNIIVACSQGAQDISEKIQNKAVKVLDDSELITDKELKCDFLISYDLPEKAIVYMARVSKATQQAGVLLDASEQNSLYPIEMLLGRAIKQDVVEGFEYEVIKKEVVLQRGPKPMSKQDIKEVAKKRYEDSTQEKKVYEKPKDDFKKKDFKKSDFKKKDFKKSESDDKWAKTKKAPNKFLGKDENGKAQFSGKSGERNHRFDGTKRDPSFPPKVGKKINIQARKPKDDSEA